MEATYTILRCPDCRAQRHDYPCQGCGSGRSGETVPVVPFDVAADALVQVMTFGPWITALATERGQEAAHRILAEHMGQTTVRAEDQRVRGASLAGEPDEEH